MLYSPYTVTSASTLSLSFILSMLLYLLPLLLIYIVPLLIKKNSKIQNHLMTICDFIYIVLFVVLYSYLLSYWWTQFSVINQSELYMRLIFAFIPSISFVFMRRFLFSFTVNGLLFSFLLSFSLFLFISLFLSILYHMYI